MRNEYTELAAAMLGWHPDDVEDWEAIEAEFEDKYGIAVGEAEFLFEDLLKLVIPQAAPLSGEPMQVFAVEDRNNPGIFTALLRRRYGG